MSRDGSGNVLLEQPSCDQHRMRDVVRSTSGQVLGHARLLEGVAFCGIALGSGLQKSIARGLRGNGVLSGPCQGPGVVGSMAPSFYLHVLIHDVHPLYIPSFQNQNIFAGTNEPHVVTQSETTSERVAGLGFRVKRLRFRV